MTVISNVRAVRPNNPAAPYDPQRPAAQPRWVHPGVLALLAATAVLYLWGLGSSGWANDFYAAAAQAGTQDWKAWLFGSLDAGNAITVDKPPGRAVGDGLVRPAVRLQRVHHAGAAGADGRRRGRRCCTPPSGAPADRPRV